jgi:hypothetical protein
LPRLIARASNRLNRDAFSALAFDMTALPRNWIFAIETRRDAKGPERL